jgi:hypothetical protein
MIAKLLQMFILLDTFRCPHMKRAKPLLCKSPTALVTCFRNFLYGSAHSANILHTLYSDIQQYQATWTYLLEPTDDPPRRYVDHPRRAERWHDGLRIHSEVTDAMEFHSTFIMIPRSFISSLSHHSRCVVRSATSPGIMIIQDPIIADFI